MIRYIHSQPRTKIMLNKSICRVAAVVLLLVLLVGCSGKSSTGLQIRQYLFEESADAFKPSVTLYEDNKFSFMYSALSSYIPTGSYEIDQDSLILKPDDGMSNKYVFEITDGALVFKAEESTEIPQFASVPDGAVFK